MSEQLHDIVARIARRDRARSEATLQADVRSFILTAGLNLSGDQVADVSSVALESQLGDGTRNRIDVEVGATVIEVKRDLDSGNTLAEARGQLASYVHRRVSQTGARYLGVLTDGRSWHLFVPDPAADAAALLEAGEPLIVSGASDTERLRYWLGTVLATVPPVKPSAVDIERRLGAMSPAHAADHETLAALFRAGKDKPEVQLKRRLWAKLLRTAFGSAFDDDERLFIDHTLLVITAEAIAHASLGFDVSRNGSVAPAELTSGSRFAAAQIFGVVESDFFDWPLEVAGGDEFVRSLADRLARYFDWRDVDHDVLKHLYESVISQESRESLGEYYTPDWLAQQVVADAVAEPLAQRVLDPSCGSGTFVFHAVKAYLAAADDAGIPNGAALNSLVDHVYGMDVHPVAVTLARVTYLLAIGSTRLTSPDRGALRVPVFLGDSVQWEQQQDLFSRAGAVTVHTAGDELVEGGGGALLEDDLHFPASSLENAARFDDLVREMADAAMDATNKLDRTLIEPIMNRANVTSTSDRATLTQTFSTLRVLHRTGNDHIWGYYVRNLIRPLWFAQAPNQVDVLVGNPPWLRYSKMTPSMQRRYLALAKPRNLLSGSKGASGRDLSTLFVVRAVELYLAAGGRFGFVMPWGTLTRQPHDGFRGGSWGAANASFFRSWDLSEAAPATGFPMVSSVVRGERTATRSRMPADVDVWSTSIRRTDLSWSSMEAKVTRNVATRHPKGPNDSDPASPYDPLFRQGAIVVPRVLLFVTERDAGPLGAGAGRRAVHSRRSTQKPWNVVEPLLGTVEAEYVHEVHLGETVLPFRATRARLAVLPISTSSPERLCTEAEVLADPAMAVWWERVEEVWRTYRKPDERLPLRERMDFRGQLSEQLPLGRHQHRVVYTASGNTLAAARLEGDKTLIEHALYWAPARSRAEAQYLSGILNSATALERVRPYQTLGLFGARHFDKLVFAVPFGAYDSTDSRHTDLVGVVEESEHVAADTDVSTASTFQAARSLVRRALASAGVDQRLESAVDAVLPHLEL